MYKRLVSDMENKKQFLQISIVAFVLSLVTQIFCTIILHGRPIVTHFPIYIILNVLHNLMNFAITPVLMFTVFHFIGKKPNLTFKLKPIMSALVIGNIASLFIGSILYPAIGLPPSAFYFLGAFLGLIAYMLPIFLLSALAGLSVGYIRQKKSTLPAEPELR